MPSKLIMSSLLLTVGLSFTARSAVQVTVDNKLYQYDNKPRLAEVLAPVALERNWYWPAAALYKLDSPEPEQLRAELLAQIAQLLLQYADDAAMQQTLHAIKTQLTSWRLAKRIAINIDYDAARIKPELNPRLDDGNYLLQLSMRPTRVYPFGAISTGSAITHQSAVALVSYAPAVQTAAQADLTKWWMLQPDGTTQAIGVAAWNQAYGEVMPGAQLFVPLKTALFNPQIEQLNQRLIELAVHRVLP